MGLGSDRLRALCQSIGFDPRAPVALFERMVSPWGYRPRSMPPGWPSEVGDDHTPFEFSLAVGATPELRVMVEPLADVPSLRSNASAALGLLDSLSQDFDVDLGRLRRISDLFLPSMPRGTFALWVAAEFGAGKTPHFKAYLNPFAQGTDLAPGLIEEALMRLGFTNTWPFIARVLTKRGHDLDELMYLSLDLSRSGQSRVKVYARHRRCTVAELEATAAGSPSYQVGDVTRFLQTVAPDRAVFDGRAPFTCYAFVQETAERPAAVTTHFPINGYAKDDDVVRSRVIAYLEQMGLPTQAYQSALAAFANRPLEAGIGIQSYVSIRRHHGKPRLTVYLPVEAYHPGTVAKPPLTVPPSGVRESAKSFDRSSAAQDPLFRRLAREPAQPAHMRTLLLNYRLSWTDMDRRIRNLASRIENPAMRELATQCLEPAAAAPASPSESCDAPSGLEPGLTFAARLDVLLRDGDPCEGFGTLIAAGLLNDQVLTFVEEQVARCDEPAVASFSNLLPRRVAAGRGRRLLAQVEQDLPDETLYPVWRGTRAFWRAARSFLADLYALCYGDAAL
ncbi:MAG TPA: tryptophan dimethylallyltransferase family protein [Polyangiaceae bacterium]|nr:tryptophan dimethylallyltransferase family protein [Polyangiaceae bacterium]